MRLAKEIVALYHSIDDANLAEEHFIKVFQKDEIPDNINSLKVKQNASIIDVLTCGNLASSKSEAKRLILQGGVKINGIKLLSFNDVSLKNNDIVQAGKRNFIRVLIEN